MTGRKPIIFGGKVSSVMTELNALQEGMFCESHSGLRTVASFTADKSILDKDQAVSFVCMLLRSAILLGQQNLQGHLDVKKA